jgi:hypothetical protein
VLEGVPKGTRPDDVFWAWVAGFWEGEGNFRVEYKQGKARHVRVVITQTDETPLLEIQKRFGGGRINVIKRRSPNPNWSTCWRLIINNQDDILRFSDLVSPFLVFRREEWETKIAVVRQLRAKHWSEEERQYVFNHRGIVPYPEMAEKLGRSINAVRHVAWMSPRVQGDY